MPQTDAQRPAIVAARRLTARIARLLVAGEASRGEPQGFVSSEAERLTLTFEGILGSRHAGWTRGADARVPWYKRGTPLRNVRHVSIVSVEELGEIAAALGLREVKPEWLGANIVLEGLPRLSFLPTGSRLFFAGEAVLAAEGYNPPCTGPGKVIAGAAGRGTPLDFTQSGKYRRGIVASVERPGEIMTGGDVSIMVPEQWIYVLLLS